MVSTLVGRDSGSRCISRKGAGVVVFEVEGLEVHGA